MVVQPPPTPETPDDKPGEAEPEEDVELTDEEKALDREYQLRKAEHRSRLMGAVADALEKIGDAPIFTKTVSHSDSVSYRCDGAVALLAAVLRQGSGPVDPLAYLRTKDSSQWSSMIEQIINAVGEMATMYTMKAQAEQVHRQHSTGGQGGPVPPPAPQPEPKGTTE